MNRRLKLTNALESQIFFTSDLHWNHNPSWKVPLWKSRGYKTLEESDDHIIRSINEWVKENDILFHLGDITLNCNEEQFEHFIDSLKCKTIYLLWGNHNSPTWKIYQREVEKYLNKLNLSNVEIYPFHYKNVVFVGNYVEVVVNGVFFFVLCHYPIYVFNHMKDNAIHLCGHSHYNLELSQANDLRSKILDVGWDGWKKPLSVSEILEVVDKKKTMIIDHHKTETNTD
jgi:calcineurin-like phosphoesterase family protein